MRYEFTRRANEKIVVRNEGGEGDHTIIERFASWDDGTDLWEVVTDAFERKLLLAEARVLIMSSLDIGDDWPVPIEQHEMLRLFTHESLHSVDNGVPNPQVRH